MKELNMAAPRSGNKGLPKISAKLPKIKAPKLPTKVAAPKIGKIRQPKGEFSKY